jgi:hypothetical protein
VPELAAVSSTGRMIPQKNIAVVDLVSRWFLVSGKIFEGLQSRALY